MNKKPPQPPKASTGDHIHAFGRAALGAVPFAGSALVEAFNTLIIPPLEKRKDKWREEVAADIYHLSQAVEGFSVEALQENDVFISVVMQASQIALRNHREEKRQALRNAIQNVAIGLAPDEDRQIMFLNFIDMTTVTQLKLLNFLQNPAKYAETKNVNLSRISTSGFGTIIEMVFPELKGERPLYDTLLEDLLSRGLTTSGKTGVTMSGVGLVQKRTSEMGDQFLAFIQKPPIEK